MSRFAIVSDSTVNLPPEYAKTSDIVIMPLVVHWGGESYLDGVTIDAETFYTRLRTSKDFPSTSQPSPGEFMAFLEKVAEEKQTDTILGVIVSSEMSGTFSSAVQAQAMLAESRPDLRIELVDSRCVSIPLGFQAMAAERARNAGMTIEETIEVVKRREASTHTIFAVDTLEFLHRGGRIGGAARLLGSALQLKPVLTFADGRIEPLEKVRSRTKSLKRLIEIVEERLNGRQPKELGYVHAEADADLVKLRAMVDERWTPEATYTVVMTPVVGTHGGPGTLGIAFYAEDDLP